MRRSAPLLFQGNDGRGAIDVSLDKMTADPSIRSQRLLEIDRTPASQGLQICPFERFLEKIERQFVFMARSDGETATVHRDARADLHLRGKTSERLFSTASAPRAPAWP